MPVWSSSHPHEFLCGKEKRNSSQDAETKSQIFDGMVMVVLRRIFIFVVMMAMIRCVVILSVPVIVMVMVMRVHTRDGVWNYVQEHVTEQSSSSEGHQQLQPFGVQLAVKKNKNGRISSNGYQCSSTKGLCPHREPCRGCLRACQGGRWVIRMWMTVVIVIIVTVIMHVGGVCLLLVCVHDQWHS